MNPKNKPANLAKRKVCKLSFKYLNLPQDHRFQEQITAIIQDIDDHQNLKYKPQRKMVIGIARAARAIVEGLYQVYYCANPQMTLSLPTSQHAYGKKPYQIASHSHTCVIRVLEALSRLGWISRKKGFKNKSGEGVPTTIVATNGLLEVFKKQSYVWRIMAPSLQDVIVLKGYDPTTHIKDIISFTDNNSTRANRKQLQTMNAFITRHAICLAMENWDLDNLIKQMSNQKYRVNWSYANIKEKPRHLNFLHTQMRRIFARGSFQLGGRFYGGWWQYIPKEYRPFITINSKPTIEVDYSELHPRLMYWEAGICAPSGDLYDLGLRHPEHPEYDPNIEPYYSQRKVIKFYLNALLNDENGTLKLNQAQIKTMGMNSALLRARIIEKHPLILQSIGKGLHFQYLDSQVAQSVMTNLLSQQILCLPVHDSFICQAEHESALIQAMSTAYESLFAGLPKIKDPVLPQAQFVAEYYPSGELDEFFMQARKDSAIFTKFHSTFKES